MIKWISKTIDDLSEFLARRKGFFPLMGIVLILVNFILQFFPHFGWIVESDLFLHLGLLFALFGFLLAWAL